MERSASVGVDEVEFAFDRRQSITRGADCNWIAEAAES
jgi:hypothetical protein